MREREEGEGRECIVWPKPQKVEGKTKSKAKQNKAKRRKKRLKQQRNMFACFVSGKCYNSSNIFIIIYRHYTSTYIHNIYIL